MNIDIRASAACVLRPRLRESFEKLNPPVDTGSKGERKLEDKKEANMQDTWLGHAGEKMFLIC